MFALEGGCWSLLCASLKLLHTAKAAVSSCSRDRNTAATNTGICYSGVTDLELNGHHHGSSKQHRGGWEGPAVPAEVQPFASCILHHIAVMAITQTARAHSRIALAAQVTGLARKRACSGMGRLAYTAGDAGTGSRTHGSRRAGGQAGRHDGADAGAPGGAHGLRHLDHRLGHPPGGAGARTAAHAALQVHPIPAVLPRPPGVPLLLAVLPPSSWLRRMSGAEQLRFLAVSTRHKPVEELVPQQRPQIR